MSATMQTAPDRRKQNHRLVSELQQERRQVWSLYCKVADLKPFPSLPDTKSIVTEFSQLLIDYISLGHFGIYEYLLSGKERRGKVLNAAQNIYPDFSKTTEAAMSFNDKYDDSLKHTFKTDELEADLSTLGESLAKRIELEDDLCRLVLK